MPTHVAVAHLAAMVAPVAGGLGLAYPLVRSWRSRLVVPLLVLSAVALALVIVAGEQGGELLDQIEAGASPREVDAATAHGRSADVVALFSFSLVATAGVAAVAARRRWSVRAADIVGALVGLSGLGVVIGAWIAVATALDAVWGG